jgi:hypothetical protein
MPWVVQWKDHDIRASLVASAKFFDKLLAESVSSFYNSSGRASLHGSAANEDEGYA